MWDSPWIRVSGIAFTILFLLPIIWCGVVWLLGKISGWSRLAGHYESNRRFDGIAYRWQSALIGPISYNRALTITLMKDGIGLTIMPLFSAGHPPLLIPWTSLHSKGTSQVLFRKLERFHIGDPIQATLAVAPNLIDRTKVMAAAAPSAPSH